MSLERDVTAAFAPGGSLPLAVDHFVARQGQIAMALAVARAIEDASALVVEASTGVGKTYSYLVPALLSGERVLLSTATKALQDQLFGRDLPRLIDALGVSVTSALLKGRASYLCLHRMSLARHESALNNRASQQVLAKIERWSQATQKGDLAELPGLDERSPLIPFVTSTRDNCLGSSCPQFRACHVNLARREALAADVVVINHHLFFADLAVRETGVAEILPSARVVIFDEAHQLNEIGIQFLGRQLGTAQLIDFSRDLLATGLQLARGLADWQCLAGECENAARELRLCAGSGQQGNKLRWTGSAPESLDANTWQSTLQAVQGSLLEAAAQLSTVSELAADFGRLQERATDLATRSALFLGACQPGSVRWLDINNQLRLVESPLTIAQAVKTRLLNQPEGSEKTWIFTSATLGDDEKLSWFTQPCGLEDAEVLRVGSPFDYAAQAALYVPTDFPKPADPGHPKSVATSVAQWATQIGGRTLVLTTTLRALRLIGDELCAAFSDSTTIEILVQGSMPKRLLVERFRSGNSDGQPGRILVASASFWEGIDIPGDALQLVVIDKLPFPPPNDPLAEARSKVIEAQGRSAFNDYFLPEAAVGLKQGAGRLIRRETDQGVLVICDTRLISMGYGRRLLRSLPAMARLDSEQALAERFAKITKICTTHCPSP